MKHGRWTILAVGALAVVSAVVAGCGSSGGSGGGGVSALPTSSCPTPIVKGDTAPDHLIVSDLPLQGASSTQTLQMGRAIEFELKQRNFKVGNFVIGYQACDDSTAAAGKWDSAQCTANANAYLANSKVLGVIGTFNSGCAKVEAPILNGGPVAMISPANTYVGLTQAGPGTEAGEPDKYFPSGKRNYARVVAADNYQGATLVKYAKEDLKVSKPFVLNDGELYGNGLAQNIRNAAKVLGLTLSGFQKWDPKATSYEPLAQNIKSSGADSVIISGIVDNQGGKLLKDLRSVLGATFPIMTPDGFTPIESVVADAGASANGTYVTVAGPPIDKLTGTGATFVKDFGATENGAAVQVYSAYAAQAANVLLDAIAASDGTRQSVVDNMLKAQVTDGIMGTFGIDQNGDTTQNPVTVYKITNAQDGKGKLTTVKVVVPEASLVKST